jgi:predicted HTH transcriptional regulator
MLIRAGEGMGLEFKSTLRWNVHAGKHTEEITYACLKTIAAFLNTSGGTLLIGVADDGSIVGIEKDGLDTGDRFLQHLSNKILSTLGEVAACYIESRIHKLDGCDVCEVLCKPSRVPVFLGGKSDEEFYVRTGLRSDRLSPSKFLEYARTRFTV